MTTRQNGMAMGRTYLFDEVFAFDDDGTPGDAAAPRARTEAAMEAARSEGYASGFEAGRRAAAEDDAARLAEAAVRLVASIAELSDATARQQRRIEEEAVRLGVAAAARLAPALISREPAAELEALLRDCLGELREAPHLAVRVCADLVDEMRERLAAVSRETGFAGDIVVLGDPDIAPGDGRIDWADGGIVRCRRTIEAAIDDAVSRYLSRPTGTPEAEDEDHG